MSCLGGSLRLWSAFVYFCFVFQIFKLGFKDIILLSQICRVCWTIWIMMSGTPLPSIHHLWNVTGCLQAPTSH